MFERCPEAPEFSMWLQASIDVSTEFCADFPSKPFCSPVEAPGDSVGDGCLPSAAGCGDVHPAQPSSDLFTEPT